MACPGSVDPDRRIPAFPAFGDLVVGTIAVITDVIGVNGTGLHYRLSLAHSDLPSWGVCPKGQSQILASPKIKLGYLTLTASCCAHSESRTSLSFGLFVYRDLLPISGQVVSLAFGGLKGVIVVGYWLHIGSRKGCRRQISKATVRPRGVVVSSPRVELYFSIFDRPEQLQVQAFVAQARIEAFNEAVLHRLTWPNVVNPVLRPRQDRMPQSSRPLPED